MTDEPQTDTPVEEGAGLPLSIGAQQVQNPVNGGTEVLLVVGTPYGQFMFPLAPKTARTIGRQLQELGSASAANLLVVKR